MSGPGLVKKLLFPAYADAGANTAFDKNDVTKRSILASASTDDIQSEATTAILDNRSHPKDHTLTTVIVTTDTVSLDSLRNPLLVATSKDERILPNESKVFSQASLSPFFPSTAPSRPNSGIKVAPSKTRAGVIDQPFPITSPRRPNSLQSKVASTTRIMYSESTNRYVNESIESQENIRNGSVGDNDQGKACVELENDEIGSDVVSTSSEMGTVINIHQRIADLNEMALMTPDKSQEYDSESEEGDKITVNLSLPLLDESPNSPIEGEKEQRDFASPGLTSGIIASAFRRMGKEGISRSGYASAPTTPHGKPSVEEYLRQFRSGESTLQVSSFLKSPGSTTRGNCAKRQNKPFLSPRFAKVYYHAKGSELSHPISDIPSCSTPTRVRQSSLSNENAICDSDKNSHFHYNTEQPLKDYRSLSPFDLNPYPHKSSLQSLMQSKSWDVGSSTFFSESGMSKFHDFGKLMASNEKKRGEQISENLCLSVATATLEHEFSSTASNHDPTIPLKTPNSIESESLREKDFASGDRVEEGKIEKKESSISKDVSSSSKQPSSYNVILDANTVEDDQISTFAQIGKPCGNGVHSTTISRQRVRNLSQLEGVSREQISAIQQLQIISEGHTLDDRHEERMTALYSLIDSFVQFREFKRVAQSAGMLLGSIGFSKEEANKLSNVPIGRNDSETSINTNKKMQVQLKCDVPEPITEAYDEDFDALKLKEVFLTLQRMMKEKGEEIQELNENLSACKAEIGRLKSFSQLNEPLKAQGLSILDGVDDFDSDSSEEVNIHPPHDPEHQFLKEGRNVLRINNNSIIRDLLENTKSLKFALDEANNTIRSLSSGERKISKEPPIVETPELKVITEDLLSSDIEVTDFSTAWKKVTGLPPPPDHEIRSPIVSALLNQWTEDTSMHQSLLAWIERILRDNDPKTIPPLTISSLNPQVWDGFQMHIIPLLFKRSDIRVEVLSRSQCRTTFDVAISVHKNISEKVVVNPFGTNAQVLAFQASQMGSSVNTEIMSTQIPSNRIVSHAFNSVEDGVDFSVQKFEERCKPLVAETEGKGFMGTIGVSSRKSLMPRPPSNKGNYEMVNGVSQQASGQQRLIGAINTGFSGLLSIGRKIPIVFDDVVGTQHGQKEHAISWNPSTPLSDEIHDETLPYQRVLSCPPGRIGVTFVQYRGHAMVSDVSQESPLLGWVFQSDILIAIDEIPVSGMRVRDIVKLLTARKDRQRALRVISSHAMNEFTLNTSALSDVGTSY